MQSLCYICVLNKANIVYVCCISNRIVISRTTDRSAGGYVLCVCLCVRVSVIISCVQNISKSYEWILMNFWRVELAQGPIELDFVGDPITLSPILPQFFTPIMNFQ